MNKKIEHIIEVEFENRLSSTNIELVEPLKKYIKEGTDAKLRNMAATVLNHISRYHQLEDTFEFFITQAKKEKSKHLRSEFIRQLQGLNSNNNSIEFLIETTNKRETIPKRNAYRALKTIKHESIEDHVLNKIYIEKDNGVIQTAIGSLTLNGTQKSIEPLIEIFKKSRDGSVRGHIVQVLEHIINRENLKEEQVQIINKFSKKSKLGFENIWKGTPNIILKNEILDETKKQLLKNKLNVEFGIDENFKASINIEKMKREYLRHFTFSISALSKSIFFKELKVPSFGTGNSFNYTEYLDKHDKMKPSEYVDEIQTTIEEIAIPFIFDIHLGVKKVINWSFKRINENYSEIIENLRIKHDHTELEYFVQLSKYKKNEIDYIPYLEHCLKLWEKAKNVRDYRTREYLINEMNTVGNKR